MHFHKHAYVPSPIPGASYSVLFPFLSVSQVNRELCLIQCSVQCLEHWHRMRVKKREPIRTTCCFHTPFFQCRFFRFKIHCQQIICSETKLIIFHK